MPKSRRRKQMKHKKSRKCRRKVGGTLQQMASDPSAPLSKSDINPHIRAKDLFYVALSSITYLSPQGFTYLHGKITKAYKKAEKALAGKLLPEQVKKVLVTLVQELNAGSKVGTFIEWRKSAGHADVVFNPFKRLYFTLTASARKRVVFNLKNSMQNLVTEQDNKPIKEPIEVPVSLWNPTVGFFSAPNVDGNGYLTIEDSALAFDRKVGEEREVKITALFRGSSSGKNWLQNLKSLVRRDEVINDEVEGSFPLGFENSLNPLMMPIIKVITATLSNTEELPLSVPVKIAITGHSLGGAMASIMFMVLMTSEDDEIAAIRKRVKIDNIHLFAISPAPILPRSLFKSFVTTKAKEDDVSATLLAERLGKQTTLVWTQYDPVPYLDTSLLSMSGKSKIPLPGFIDRGKGWAHNAIRSHTNVCLTDKHDNCISTFYDNAFKAKAIEALAEKDTSYNHLKKCPGELLSVVMQRAVPFPDGHVPGVGMDKVSEGATVQMTNFVDRFIHIPKKTGNNSTVSPLYSELKPMEFYEYITGACEPKGDNGCPPDVDSINNCSTAATTTTTTTAVNEDATAVPHQSHDVASTMGVPGTSKRKGWGSLVPPTAKDMKMMKLRSQAVAAVAAGGSRRRTRRRRPYKR